MGISVKYMICRNDNPSKSCTAQGISLPQTVIYLLIYLFQEYSFTPSDRNLFSGYDWIIGNHSDELTPWIPVIAARLVLP